MEYEAFVKQFMDELQQNMALNFRDMKSQRITV